MLTRRLFIKALGMIPVVGPAVRRHEANRNERWSFHTSSEVVKFKMSDGTTVDYVRPVLNIRIWSEQ